MAKVSTETNVNFVFVDSVIGITDDEINNGTIIFCKENMTLYLKYDDELLVFSNNSNYKIIDNVTTHEQYWALSANQGRILNEKITALEERIAALEATNNNLEERIAALEAANNNGV